MKFRIGIRYSGELTEAEEAFQDIREYSGDTPQEAMNRYLADLAVRMPGAEIRRVGSGVERYGNRLGCYAALQINGSFAEAGAVPAEREVIYTIAGRHYMPYEEAYPARDTEHDGYCVAHALCYETNDTLARIFWPLRPDWEPADGIDSACDWAHPTAAEGMRLEEPDRLTLKRAEQDGKE